MLAIAAGSALLLLLSACGGDAAQAGDAVSVHYTGTLDDGSVFDSSEGHDPLKFELGSGQVINGFDAAVMGLSIGEELTVRMAELYFSMKLERCLPRFKLNCYGYCKKVNLIASGELNP